MSGGVSLPDGFAALERFVPDWALASEAERNAKRLASSIGDIRAFYDAMRAQLDAIGEHLGPFDIATLPETERRLFYLALSFMEVAPAVEIHGAPDVPDAIEADRFLILSP